MEKQQLHSIKMFEGDTTASYTLFQSEASETPDKMNHKCMSTSPNTVPHRVHIPPHMKC